MNSIPASRGTRSEEVTMAAICRRSVQDKKRSVMRENAYFEYSVRDEVFLLLSGGRRIGKEGMQARHFACGNNALMSESNFGGEVRTIDPEDVFR